jgi:hypothetical protein
MVNIAHRSDAKQGKQSTLETQPSEKMAGQDLDEEEKARKIAEEDLRGHCKQVWNKLPPPNPRNSPGGGFDKPSPSMPL